MTKIPRDISLDEQLMQLARLTFSQQTNSAILFGVKKTIDEIMMAYIEADIKIKLTDRSVQFVEELKKWQQHKDVFAKSKLFKKMDKLHSPVIRQASFIITLDSVYNTVEDARFMIRYVKSKTSIVVDEQCMIDIMLDGLGL